ncbi:MAG: hypothetical protein AAF763_02360 [Pseudomonadota bacterium]
MSFILSTWADGLIARRRVDAKRAGGRMAWAMGEERAPSRSLMDEGGPRRGWSPNSAFRPGKVGAGRAYATRGACRDAVQEAGETLVAASLVAAVWLKRRVQASPRATRRRLSPSLSIIEDGGETTVSSGRVDIHARDEDGTAADVELKSGTSDGTAAAQRLGRMGDLTEG